MTKERSESELRKRTYSAAVTEGSIVSSDIDDYDLEHEELSALNFTRRKLIGFGLFIVLSIVSLYVLLPQLAGLDDTWHRVESGSPGWLLLAFVATVGSFFGYVTLFQFVFVSANSRITWRESYQITMAGLAATRLFAAAGAGGIVLTAWALRRAGLRPREVSDKTICFLVLTYAVYIGSLVICGFGLYFGIFPGANPVGVTLVPAVVGVVIIGLAMLMALVPTDFQKRLEGYAQRKGFFGRFAHKAANVPASVSAGMHDAWKTIKTRNPALLGAVAFWGFQIAVLWAAFEAFGEPPSIFVIIMAFFIGMFGNLLPMPGGVGGVDAGLVLAFTAFGVDAGLAFVAVLVYRAFVFWLPIIPGAIAFFQLRRTVKRWKQDGRRTPVPT